MRIVLVVMLLVPFTLKAQRSSSEFTFEQRKTLIELPKTVKYDTVKGLFYYEQHIGSYIAGDAIIEGGNYISAKNDSVNIEAYKNGYYIARQWVLEKLKEIDTASKNSSSSVVDFLKERRKNDASILWQQIGVNPYCEVYYRKFYIEAIVLDMGMQHRYTPILIKDCDAYEKYKQRHSYKAYKVKKLHTYAFVEILNWKEI